jgi:Holliday junction resolvasome RuvABC ATP-dependent DNA helicase subunit
VVRRAAIPFALSLGMDDDNLDRRDIEPPSVRTGLIRHPPRGRAATRATYLLPGVTVPPLINRLS